MLINSLKNIHELPVKYQAYSRPQECTNDTFIWSRKDHKHNEYAKILQHIGKVIRVLGKTEPGERDQACGWRLKVCLNLDIPDGMALLGSSAKLTGTDEISEGLRANWLQNSTQFIMKLRCYYYCFSFFSHFFASRNYDPCL